MIEAVRQAADEGDWARYCERMGGPMASRKDAPVQLLQVWSDKPGCYGEPVGFQIAGVRAGDILALSRRHDWTIKSGRAQGGEGPERNCTQGRAPSGPVPAPLDVRAGPCQAVSGPIPAPVPEPGPELDGFPGDVAASQGRLCDLREAALSGYLEFCQ